jgi:hypothetical protein
MQIVSYLPGETLFYMKDGKFKNGIYEKTNGEKFVIINGEEVQKCFVRRDPLRLIRAEKKKKQKQLFQAEQKFKKFNDDFNYLTEIENRILARKNEMV